MDNDDKIKATGKAMQTNEQRHKEVLLFLNEELNRLQTTNSADSYNLEEEYAKTKKNKSLFSFLIIAISIIIVFLASWGISAHIKKQNQEIKVNLSEFEGLNIKNLLDSVSKVQSNYDNAMKNKTNIISDRDLALRKAEEKRDSDLFLLESLNLEGAQFTERKDKILEEYENSIKLVNEFYNPQLILADNELAEYKKQLDEYDTAKLEAARQQEQALDSERRVHQLEIDKISGDYEARISEIQEAMELERKNNSEQIRSAVSEVSQKYLNEIAKLDPDLKNDKMAYTVSVLAASETESFDSKKIIEENAIKDESVAQGLKLFQDSYSQYSSVLEPFENIPYKHSLPSYIKASKKLVDNMGQTFGSVSLKLYGEKEELNGKIDNLNNQISGLNSQIAQIKKDNEAEKQKLREEFAQEKAVLAQDYIGLYDGILASAKASAVVVSAHSKDSIRIYIVPDQRDHISQEGVGAEIKASKSIKGIVKPIADEPGFYLFENALDKKGEPIEFDFELISAGQIVKISSK